MKSKKGVKMQPKSNKGFVPTGANIKGKVLSTENSAFTKKKGIMSNKTE